MSAAEQYQQQRLTVQFVHRFVDNEMLAASGDPRQIFVNAFALSGACGFTLGLLLCLRHIFRINDLAEPVRQAVIAGDRQLLILLTMTLTGLFTVLAWDTLMPDGKDANILGVLPVPPRVILKAKLTAALLYFAVLQALFQFFVLALPLVSGSGGWSGLALGIFWQSVVLWSVALLVFFGAMAVQGLLTLTLPYRWFLTVSSGLQLLWLIGSISITFVAPPLEQSAAWGHWLPSSWFLDSWQSMMGQRPVYGTMPAAAPFLLAGGVAIAALSMFAAGFRRILRRVVEGASTRRSGPGRVAGALRRLMERLFLREPREKAAFLFAARTLLRHRNARLMLVVFGGLALCWTMVSLSEALQHGVRPSAEPSALLLSIPLDFSFLLLLGMRVMFSLPVELPSNWIFRLLDRDGEEWYLRGVRKLLFLGGCAPLALLLAPGYLMLWGPAVTLRHTLLILLAGWLMTELMLRGFHKFPFACSWTPGKANLKVTLGAWVLLFTSLSWMAGAIEAAAVRTPGGTVRLAVILALLIAWRVWVRKQAASTSLAWEDAGPAGLELLHLER